MNISEEATRCGFYALLLSSLAIVALISYAEATQQQAYVGVIANSPRTIGGVRVTTGAVITPLMTSIGFLPHHRDYAVYVNHFDSINGDQAIGSGWLSYKATSSSSVVNYDLGYYKKIGSGAAHSLWRTLATGTPVTAKVEQQTSSSSDCWKSTISGSTFSDFQTICFNSGSFHPGSVAGATGRTFSAYVSGSNTMPGQFDRLYYYYWSGSTLTYDSSSYFSTSDLTKCYSTYKATGSGWIIDYMAKYSTDPNGQQIDKVAVGPIVAVNDDCPTGNLSQQWELKGE